MLLLLFCSLLQLALLLFIRYDFQAIVVTDSGDKLDKDNFADPNENYHILETEIIKQRLKHLPTKKSNIRNINTKNQDGLLME